MRTCVVAARGRGTGGGERSARKQARINWRRLGWRCGSAGGGLGEVLQLSTERFAGQFGDAPWGLVVTSLEPGRSGRCLTVSETFGRQSGYGPAELIGKDFLSIIHPEDQPALDDLIGHLAAGAIGQIGIEARMLAKDGSAVVLQLDGRALKAVDGTGYLAIYTQDSTEIVRLRAELRQLESELTRSRRLETLGQLTEGIAHDFNKLLTVIASYSSLVNDEITVAEATEGTFQVGPGPLGRAADRGRGRTRSPADQAPDGLRPARTDRADRRSSSAS